MAAEEGFEGRCACGEIRYRMTSAPLFVHACHCTECQRLSGSAFALNALIETDRLELLTGDTEADPVAGTSGKPQTIHRCPHCRVALWSHYPGAGQAAAFVRVGTLDEPARLPPDIAIFTSSRLPWLPLPEGIPAVEHYYDRRDHWPAESLARLDAARGRPTPTA
ncbi:GFA family protein [Sphingosinicella terrae]|uniref:GFA family protein n=1 Tax=Sphingosinicella terrae TaxID=2172047 RepID=UPI000E0D264E|nr:GFA family protein [Sphingosinicella terrae]